MKAPVVVLDHELRPVADLGEVTALGYTQHLRELWTASFTIRADDPKRVYCKPYAFVRIYEGEKEIGLFRIAPERAQRGRRGQTITYQCEHVLATLCDDMLLGHHNVDPPSTNLRDALEYILSKQTTPRWVLHELDFSKTWWHFWENRTLLEALFDALVPVYEDWMFAFDTSVTPWRLSIISPPATVEAYLDAGRNLDSVQRDSDPRGIVTRLYAYGYGAGADQLTIASVNPTGKEYIDADTLPEYGVIVRRWENQHYTDAQALYEAAVARLERLKRPTITYTIGAVDLSRITGFSTDRLRLGALVRVTDEELGIDQAERIATITKRDIIGAPGDVAVVIGERREFPDYGDIIYADNLDDVPAPGAYGKVLSTQIKAGEILLSAVPGGQVGAFKSPPKIGGLYVGATHFGYHNGTEWITYMDASGRLFCKSSGGSLEFDPTQSPPKLSIRGIVEILPGSVGYLNLEDVPEGLITSYFEPSPPTPPEGGFTVGDLWFDTDDGNRMYRWSGTEWVDVQDEGIWEALQAAMNAQATADGKVKTYFQATAPGPEGLTVGDLWVNTADHNKLHRWNGSAWITFTGALASLNVLGTAYIEDLAVTTAKIADLAVTSAKISSLTFSKLTAGTNTASLVIGSGGEIKSANYSPGSAGFRIRGDGTAEFNTVTVRGALHAGAGSTIGGQYITGTLTGCVFQGAASYPYAYVAGQTLVAYQSAAYYGSLSPSQLTITGATDTVILTQSTLRWYYGAPIIQAGGDLTLKCGSGYRIFLDPTGGDVVIMGIDTSLRPYIAEYSHLGRAAYYWNQINYKNLIDRGCLGWFDGGVRLRDGRIVSDMQALKEIRPHPTLRTPYGTPRLDYATLPEPVYWPAPVATEDIDDGTRTWKRGEKMGEDGASLDALVSIMLGALRELDQRLERLERLDAGKGERYDESHEGGASARGGGGGA